MKFSEEAIAVAYDIADRFNLTVSFDEQGNIVKFFAFTLSTPSQEQLQRLTEAGNEWSNYVKENYPEWVI